jgi:hypothetical protein
MADLHAFKDVQVSVSRDPAASDVKFDGSLEFVHEYGGNESKPSYQEASGAPVETISPLGLQVTWFSTILLNIGQMIGTGVFSTRKFLFISHMDSGLTDIVQLQPQRSSKELDPLD